MSLFLWNKSPTDYKDAHSVDPKQCRDSILEVIHSAVFDMILFNKDGKQKSDCLIWGCGLYPYGELNLASCQDPLGFYLWMLSAMQVLKLGVCAAFLSCLDVLSEGLASQYQVAAGSWKPSVVVSGLQTYLFIFTFDILEGICGVCVQKGSFIVEIAGWELHFKLLCCCSSLIIYILWACMLYWHKGNNQRTPLRWQQTDCHCGPSLPWTPPFLLSLMSWSELRCRSQADMKVGWGHLFVSAKASWAIPGKRWDGRCAQRAGFTGRTPCCSSKIDYLLSLYDTHSMDDYVCVLVVEGFTFAPLCKHSEICWNWLACPVRCQVI